MKFAPYSYSRLALYERCPAAFKFKYIDKIPEAKSPNLVIGSLVHKIVEKYFSSLCEARKEYDLQRLEEIWQEVTDDLPYKNDLLPYKEGVKNLYFPTYADRVLIEAPVGIDREWKLVKFDSPQAFLRGKIDFSYFLSSSLIIVDWKTDRKPPLKEEAEKSRQLKVYALLGASLTDTEVKEIEITVALYYLRSRLSSKTVILSDEIEETREWVLETVARIEAEKEWLPTPGTHCEWCSFISYCPAAKEATNLTDAKLPTAISSPEEWELFSTSKSAVLQLLRKLRRKDLLEKAFQTGEVEKTTRFGFRKV